MQLVLACIASDVVQDVSHAVIAAGIAGVFTLELKRRRDGR